MSRFCLIRRLWNSTNWNVERANKNWEWKNEASKFNELIEAAQGVIKKAEFPEEAAPKWNTATADGNIHALVAILFSQLHNLVSLRLDYTFVWQSGFSGLMLRHALFSAPNGTMSKCAHLATVDYGSNVPLSEEEELLLEHHPEGYPSGDPNQSWRGSTYRLSCLFRYGYGISRISSCLRNLNNYIRSLLAQQLLIRRFMICFHTPNQKALHLGLAYKTSPALDNPYTILDALQSVSQTVEALSMGMEYYPFSRGNHVLDYSD